MDTGLAPHISCVYKARAVRAMVALACLAALGILSSSAGNLPAHVSISQEPPIQFRVVFKTEIDTTEAKLGDRVEGYLRDDIKNEDEQVIAPAGSKVFGHIEELTHSRTLAKSVASGKFHRHGSLRIAFDEIVTPNKQHLSIEGLADTQISIFNNHDLEIFRQITVGPDGELRKAENLDMFQISELEIAVPTSALDWKGHYQVHIQPGDELKVHARFVDDDASSTAVSGKVMTHPH